MKLNIGCGDNKIPGYINVDVEKSVKPDLLHDFTQTQMPYKSGTVDEIVMFHTIEHIRKCYHDVILSEFARLLKTGGKVIISYPNFRECYKLWERNYGGKRGFWEATIFGLQRYPSDHHVCIMDPIELQQRLLEVGFENVRSVPEEREKFNTVTVGTKGKIKHYYKYEDLLREDMKQLQVKVHKR